MDYKTCEEYVLGELETANEKLFEKEELIERLKAENSYYSNKIDELCNFIKDNFERYELPFSGEVVYLCKNSIKMISKGNAMYDIASEAFKKDLIRG